MSWPHDMDADPASPTRHGAPSGAERRQFAVSKVRWLSGCVAIVAVSAATAIGFVESARAPVTSAIAQPVTGSTTGSSVAGSSSVSAPRSTASTATVVSGGTAVASGSGQSSTPKSAKSANTTPAGVRKDD